MSDSFIPDEPDDSFIEDSFIADEEPVSHAQRTENLIAERQSLIPAYRNQVARDMIPSAQDTAQNILMPWLGLAKAAPKAALAMTAGQEAFESAQANPMLALQRGRPQDMLGDMIKGLKGERVAERGDLLRTVGAPEPLAAIVGMLTSPETAIPTVMGMKKTMQAGRGATRLATKTAMDVKTAFTHPAIPTDPADLLKMSEMDAARMPAATRQRYLAGQAQAAQSTLANERLAFTQKAQKAQAFISQRQANASSSLPSTAADDLEGLQVPFRQLASKQNAAYKTGMESAITQAEQASGQKITFSREQLNQSLAEKFLRQGMNEDPIEYRNVQNLLNKHEITNAAEIPAREIINIADQEYGSIGTAAKQKLRAYTPDEVASQHLRDLLLDEVEKRGIDVRGVKSEWAQWVPTRNLGLKLQTPSGPGQLIRILKGTDPVRAKNFQDLEALLGERVDRDTRQVFDQLDYLKQQKVVQQAKQAEFQRVMQERSGLSKGSAADRKWHVEERAKHLKNIRYIVLSVAAAASAGITGGPQAIGFVRNQFQ